MPSLCCVPNCNGNYRKGPRVSIFSFPRDKVLASQWLRSIKRGNFTPTASSRSLTQSVSLLGLGIESGTLPTAGRPQDDLPALSPSARALSVRAGRARKQVGEVPANLSHLDKTTDRGHLAAAQLAAGSWPPYGTFVDKIVCELHFIEDDFRREASATDAQTGIRVTAPLKKPVLHPEAVQSILPNCPT
ncbi:hypothetical protein GWK47_041395 [Chionoecetes opilio]|uniref:THAP-type domain-containing protein n=1 Tax=Chionoecetes opilio TaxID=41210 RepID=A0A8J5CZH5_CHIOP|nr:hypothetical protein GWK47_041395 [Chionoecetes opilio]